VVKLTDEQKSIRDLAHDFAEREIRPGAVELDRDGTWPGEILSLAWKLGLTNNYLPEAYGGTELPDFDVCLMVEELAWGCAGVATSLVANDLAMAPLIDGGSEQLKRRYLGAMSESPINAAFALTEPGAGSDVSSLRTSATRTGHAYVINGAKCFITNGGHADWYTVFARTGPHPGHKGISAFVVPRAAGVVVDKKEDKLGQRASETVSLSFDNVEIPADHLIGAESDGFALAMRTLDRTRPAVGAAAVGIARAALEHACEYATERVQFGTPIANHQAVQFMIADMATEIEAARLLVWNAATLADDGADSTLASSHAKRFAGDVAMNATLNAVQIFGGYGYIKDYPVEKLMRDAKLLQIYEGTAQIQRIVIARRVLATTTRRQAATAVATG
jgi:acyl-CoA dehydrogenase